MTVAELIAELQKRPQRDPVLLSNTCGAGRGLSIQEVADEPRAALTLILFCYDDDL